MMILFVLIGLATLACAIQAIRARRLLISAIWLAGASALTALLLYLLGAVQVAVIELSVGAGLVTVLFVFAINISGEEIFKPARLVPRALAWSIVLIAAAILMWISFDPFIPNGFMIENDPFAIVLWEIRGIDIVLQGLLVFAGVLAVLGLMAEDETGEVKS